MPAVIVMKCSGAWDGGRFPCRASLPIPVERVRRPRDWDAADLHAARIVAWEAGWRYPDPDGPEDFCPSCWRQRLARAQSDAARRLAENDGISMDALRDLL